MFPGDKSVRIYEPPHDKTNKVTVPCHSSYTLLKEKNNNKATDLLDSYGI